MTLILMESEAWHEYLFVMMRIEEILQQAKTDDINKPAVLKLANIMIGVISEARPL